MVIDTETHIFYFTRPSYTNEDSSLVRHCSWHEHTAELLIAEMDRAGVDKSIVISYDAEDILWFLLRNGMGVEDFSGGKKYTQKGVSKFPDRLIWFTTLKDPKKYAATQILREDYDKGARGVKIFPAYIQVSLDEPAMLDVFAACADMDMPVLISFEDLQPPDTLDLDTYLGQLRNVLLKHPRLNFGLMHGGCADPLVPGAIDGIAELTRAHANLYLSTAKVGNLWDDGTEYPFPNYLRRLQILSEAVGPGKLMWATDWPWYDHFFIYEQGANATRRHAHFWSEAERADFMGLAAARFLKLA